MNNGWLLLGVQDGHGVHGHLVSQFVKNQLPKQISIPDNNIEKGMQQAFLSMQQLLFKSKIECAMSGSTCVICLFTGDYLVTCNLGDSRAILCSKTNNSWHFKPLSHDHKPENPMEKARILAMGGRVAKITHPVHG